MEVEPITMEVEKEEEDETKKTTITNRKKNHVKNVKLTRGM